MLTSEIIRHSGAPIVSFIREHLEDHERGEFTKDSQIKFLKRTIEHLQIKLNTIKSVLKEEKTT